MLGPSAALPLDPRQLREPLAVPSHPELRGGDAPRNPLPLPPRTCVQVRERVLPVRHRRTPPQLRRPLLEQLDTPPARTTRPWRGGPRASRHALEQARALRTIATLTSRFERGGSRAGDPGSAGAPSSHTRPPSVSTHPSPGRGSDAIRPSSPTAGHAARPDPPKCPARRLSSSRDQASRTLGSPPRGSVGARRAASSAYRRSHSAADCRRSSADEAASAVQNVAAAPFFLLFVAIEKKNNKG